MWFIEKLDKTLNTNRANLKLYDLFWVFLF